MLHELESTLPTFADAPLSDYVECARCCEPTDDAVSLDGGYTWICAGCVNE